MTTTPALVDALDRVVAHSVPLLTPDEVDAAAFGAEEVRRRRGHLGGTLLLAIAGGTGTGKSSLVNALAGEAVASVSPVRPHTDEPMAWVPADAEPGVETRLNEWGVERVVRKEGLPGIAVLDLPDADSVVTRHQVRLREMVARADVVTWVVDPEKYRDPRLLNEFVAPEAAFRPAYLFVLNKIDRLGDDVDAVTADLRRALERAGLVDPPVFPVAAAPEVGPPLGVAELAEHLRERLDAKRAALGKLVADARRTAGEVERSASLDRRPVLDLERRWRTVGDGAVAALARPAPGSVEDALCRVEDFVITIALESGGATGERIKQRFAPPHLEAVLAGAVDVAAAADSNRLAAQLDAHVLAPLRRLVRPRAELAAALAWFAVEAAEAEAALEGTGPVS